MISLIKNILKRLLLVLDSEPLSVLILWHLVIHIHNPQPQPQLLRFAAGPCPPCQEWTRPARSRSCRGSLPGPTCSHRAKTRLLMIMLIWKVCRSLGQGPCSWWRRTTGCRLFRSKCSWAFRKLLLVLVDLAGHGLDPLLCGLREVFWKLHCRRRWQLTSRRLHTDLLRSHWWEVQFLNLPFRWRNFTVKSFYDCFVDITKNFCLIAAWISSWKGF